MSKADSSNVNEVTKAILNSFIQKLHNHKQAQNAYKRTKTKNATKEPSKETNSHLFAYLRFCVFDRVYLCHLVLLVLLVFSVYEIFS